MLRRKLLKDRPHQKYFLRDGTEVIGCSTVSGLAENKEGLIRWANKQGLAGKNSTEQRDAAADGGTVAHGLIEAWLVGDELDVSDFTPDAQASGNIAFDKFKQWWAGQKMAFIYAELQLVSHEHKFGGTPDLVARDIEHKKCLIDFKTSKSLQTSHCVQAAGGYLILENENSEEPVDKVCILRLPKDDSNIEPLWLHSDTYPHYQRTFLANLEAFYARRSLGDVDPIEKKKRKWKKK